MKKLLLSIFSILCISQLTAQSNLHNIHIKRTNATITLDGNLEEQAWLNAAKANNFIQHFPTDSLPESGETEILLTYDDKNLYVGIRCKSTGDQFITQSLKRDGSFHGNDNISLMFDTFNDVTNAFMFGINAFGVRREAIISNGGKERSHFSRAWDNKWYGDAVIQGDTWTAELAIPFKTLRFKEGAQSWRFQCYRNDTQNNEHTSWAQIPFNFLLMDIACMGTIVWDQPLTNAGKNISLIPYVSSSIARDFEDDTETEPQTKFNFGGDAKVGITSGLNLDLTVNPDFSQVEVDQQVTNLDRFEVFFPERRQFFLENADLFGGFGGGRVNPFFSRRIGVTQDTATGTNIQNTILYGARLSGKLNEKLRVGLLNMQTAKQEINDLPSFNYTVATLEQRVFSRSNLAFIFVNKQAINPDEFGTSFNKYNRAAGVEYRLASADNVWSGKTTYHRVFSPLEKEHKFSHLTQIVYTKRKYRFEWAHLMIGNGYDAEVGFVPRKDILLLSPEAQINFYPSNRNLTNHSIGFDTRWIYKLGKDDNTVLEDFGFADFDMELFWSFNFKNSSRLRLESTFKNLILLNDFDPTRVQDDDVFLPAGNRYKFMDFSINYQSDGRKVVSYNVEPQFGQFYSGFRAGFRGSINYRYQPYGFVALNVNYNHINLGDPFKTVNLWLVGPRIDLTFTKKLFLTTFLQYNNQLDNLNVNARFQWRFKPASDLFIVYTDNFITDPFDQFSSRNKALVAKLTYWLNL